MSVLPCPPHATRGLAQTRTRARVSHAPALGEVLTHVPTAVNKTHGQQQDLPACGKIQRHWTHFCASSTHLSSLPKSHLKLILPSASRSSKCTSPTKFPDQEIVRTVHVPKSRTRTIIRETHVKVTNSDCRKQMGHVSRLSTRHEAMLCLFQ